MWAIKRIFTFYDIFTLITKIIYLAILLFLFLNFDIFNLKYKSPHIEKILEENNYKNFDILKAKTIDPIIENITREISIIKHIFNKKYKKIIRRKNKIHITVSLNDNKDYKYILYVSMFSLLYNCNKDKSFIIYHILCSPDFNENSTSIFKSLFKNFSHNVEMIFYNMGNSFNNRRYVRFSQATFFRILTPLFIDSDRIIHLDGDTLIFSDLNEMYNLDFNDNYILGLYDFFSFGIDYLGLNSKIYINAGVTLFNLKKLREDNKVFELLNLTNSDTKLVNDDQSALNYVLHPKIGRLPSKYAMFNFEDKSDLNIYLEKIRTKIPIEELEESFNNTAIIHIVLCFPKPWFHNSIYTKDNTNCLKRRNCSCEKYHKLWHSIANKTEYYNEIKNFTG